MKESCTTTAAPTTVRVDTPPHPFRHNACMKPVCHSDSRKTFCIGKTLAVRSECTYDSNELKQWASARYTYTVGLPVR